jgi:hypothetical protein
MAWELAGTGDAGEGAAFLKVRVSTILKSAKNI